MKKPTTATEPRFIDEQSGLINPLPIFVTHTTLRSILHKIGAKKLLDLAAHSTASIPSEPTVFDTTLIE